MVDKIAEQLRALSNPTISEYLSLMENTETPALFHAWSILSAASACLTRRCWFDMGAIRIMPNQFIMLVGPPGVRKSEGIKFVRSLLKDLDGLRFGPNNTAGRLQGLLAAMQGKRKIEQDADDAVESVLEGLASFDIAGLSDAEDADIGHTHTLNRHALYVAESELVGFLGMKSNEFTDFLGDMWDKSGSDDYSYQLKRETVRVALPCLNLIGAITPMHITSYLPPTAIGQGFTSRVLMVYADSGKKVAWPEPLDEALVTGFRNVMRWIFEVCEGPFTYTPAAKREVIRLYDYKVEIEDIRFLHYKQRRQTHMIKIAMAMAALRMDMEINENDILDAHAMLALTEARMPECLGEYGLSPLALAMSRIKEVLRNTAEPLTIHRLLIACGSDVKRLELTRALHEMTASAQIVELHLRDPRGAVKIGYVWPRENNPFKMREEVQIEYLHDEEPGAKKSTLEKDAALLAGPRRENKVRGSFDDLPDAVEELAETATLAAQGYASVAEKLQAFIANRRNMH